MKSLIIIVIVIFVLGIGVGVGLTSLNDTTIKGETEIHKDNDVKTQDPTFDFEKIDNESTIVSNPTRKTVKVNPISIEINEPVIGKDVFIHSKNAELLNISANSVIRSLILDIESVYSSGVIVSIDRNYLDSKLSNGLDDSFIVLVNGIEIDHDELKSNTNYRVLEFLLPDRTNHIEILGTDWGESAALKKVIQEPIHDDIPRKQIEIVEPTNSEAQQLNQDSSTCDEVGTSLVDPLFSKPCYNEKELELLIHNKINEQRIKSNQQPLSFDYTLNQIAKSHSRDMVNKDYFSHISNEGKDMYDRYSQVGYACEIIIENTIFSGAENIAQNGLYDSYTDSLFGRTIYEWNTMDEIAQSVVTGWMNSHGHRDNILKSIWKSEGIGVSISQIGEVYITQNFC